LRQQLSAAVHTNTRFTLTEYVKMQGVLPAITSVSPICLSASGNGRVLVQGHSIVGRNCQLYCRHRGKSSGFSWEVGAGLHFKMSAIYTHILVCMLVQPCI